MTDTSIKSALAQGKNGFHIGHRLILPFRCQIIKIIVDNAIYTQMIGHKDIKLHQDPKNTSIYFTAKGQLANYIGSYEQIKLIVCEEDDDLCDLSSHMKIICTIEEHHKVNIETATSDTLFIE